jgi:RNA polymerase sigma factor (sigma-70 family)
MSGGDPHEADDVYGDTTLALWRKRRRYRPLPPPWVVWAIEVMRRCASGRRRHRAGQLESKTSVDSELTSWATSEEDSPETATINSMWREAVRASIRSLDEELQAVVVMRLFLNIPFREITKLLNLGEGPGPAYHRFAQALKQLRQSLSNSWGGDG